MKICENLYKDINFEPESIQPCCNIHGIVVPQFPFSGGAFPARAYLDHINNVIEELQKSGNICKGCPDLRVLPDGRNYGARMLFRSVSFNQHRFFCNCKCDYCDLWQHKDRGYGYDVLPALESLKEQNLLDENCFFSWGGGEPSILPGFENAASWVTGHGYWQNVHTNALIYSPAIGKMLKRGQGQINISLDSSSPQIYKAVKGVNGFAKVTDSLKRYVHDARDTSQIVLKYIIFEKNNSIPEIEHFLKLCASLGIKHIQLSLDFREINANSVSEQTCLAAAFLKTRGEEYGLEVSPFFLPREIEEKISKISDANFK